jgi:deoxyribonuclease V
MITSVATHPWPRSVAEARTVQEGLRSSVVLEDDLGEVTLVAGADVGFEEGGRVTRAAVAVLTFPSLELRDRAVVRRETTFPYVPGYLSFREAPAVLDALGGLAEPPHLILCDGQGYAHPRRFGLACHLGVLADIPTIGVAKSRLVGSFEEPGPEKGDRSPLVHREETVGAVVRTRRGVKPLFVSSGHRVSLETAVVMTLRCTTKYRLPETTRWAHRLASG